MPRNKTIQEKTELPAVSKCNEAYRAKHHRLPLSSFMQSVKDLETMRPVCSDVLRLHSVIKHVMSADADVNIFMIVLSDWLHFVKVTERYLIQKMSAVTYDMIINIQPNPSLSLTLIRPQTGVWV